MNKSILASGQFLPLETPMKALMKEKGGCTCIFMRRNLAWCLNCICKRWSYLNNSLFGHIRHYHLFFFPCIHCGVYRGKHYSSTWHYWLVWVFPAHCKEKSVSVKQRTQFALDRKKKKSIHINTNANWLIRLHCGHMQWKCHCFGHFLTCLCCTFLSLTDHSLSFT